MGSYSTIVYDEKSDLMRGVASVWFFFWGGGGVGVQISRILYINISEIWPDKRGGLSEIWPDKCGGLWWEYKVIVIQNQFNLLMAFLPF
jgi:hypothetical protein